MPNPAAAFYPFGLQNPYTLAGAQASDPAQMALLLTEYFKIQQVQSQIIERLNEMQATQATEMASMRDHINRLEEKLN